MITVPTPALWELREAYGRPRRHYHTFDHALFVADQVKLAHTFEGFQHPSEAMVAALYHDAVYNVGRDDNEMLSADMAVNAIQRFSMDVDPEIVSGMIERTRDHGLAVSLTHDEALFLDCDIAVLGADEHVFDLYSNGIRKEYLREFPVEVYEDGRKRFLAKLLALPRIYSSMFFYNRLEAAARANITRALNLPAP